MKHSRGSHSDDFNDTEPCYCDELKPMQNNETNWEDKFDTLLQDYFISKESDIKEIKSFISQEKQKSCQKGKEERERETVDERVWRCVRNETLEEVEKVIKEKASIKTEDKVVDIAILLFSEDILQQINKMKTNEKTN